MTHRTRTKIVFYAFKFEWLFNHKFPNKRVMKSCLHLTNSITGTEPDLKMTPDEVVLSTSFIQKCNALISHSILSYLSRILDKFSRICQYYNHVNNMISIAIPISRKAFVGVINQRPIIF